MPESPTGRTSALSLSQQAALMPERTGKADGPAANLFVAVELRDADVAALERSAVAAIADNEILRTVYPADRRMPYAQVQDVPGQVIEIVDSAADAFALTADAVRRFDLAIDTPLRARYYRENSVLSLAVHPVAADDRSLDLLVDAIVTGARTGRQFREFAGEQLQNLAATAATDDSLAFWTEQLSDLPEPVVSVAAATGVHTFRVEQTDTAAIVGTLAAALRAVGLGEDVTIGLVEPARATAGADDVIGPFANQLALRVTDGASVADLLTRARAHASTRIERLTHLLKRESLFQALVNVRRAVRDEIVRRPVRPYGVDVVFDVVVDDTGATVTADLPASFGAYVEHGGDAPTLFAPAAASYDFFLPGQGGDPVTDDERTVAAAIRTVLDLDEYDDVGREDTFFSLGGDSIAALRLVTVLAEQGHALDVQTVFEYPSIAQLAEQLTAAEPAAAPVQEPPAAALSASGLDDAALAALGKKFSAK